MPKTKLARSRFPSSLGKAERIAGYLAAAARKPNPNAFLMAVAKVVKARGIAQIARDSGLGRESLYKALARGAKPRFATVRKLVTALGLKLTVTTRR